MNTIEGRRAVDSRIEEYQDLALKQWIPQAYGSHRDGTLAIASANASRALAKLLLKGHGDSFLSNLLTQRNLKNSDFDLLAAKIVNSGKWRLQPVSVDTTTRLDGIPQDSPVALRLKLEQIYIQQRLGRGDACLAGATSLLRASALKNYEWMHGQVLLEKFNCEYMLGALDLASRDLKSAIAISKRSGFPVLELRAKGLRSEFRLDTGERALQWSETTEALRSYYAGLYPATRAYQLYISLAYSAEEEEQWQTALLLNRSALEFADKTNPLFQAMIREHLGEIATRAGNAGQGHAYFAAAAQLFDMAPQDEMATRYKTVARINEAKLDLSEQRYSSAERLSLLAQHSLPEIHDDFIQFDYLFTMGALKYATGHKAEGLSFYADALRISEKRLASIHTQRERLKWLRENSNVYRTFVEALLECGRSEAALEAWEYYKAAGAESSRRKRSIFKSISGSEITDSLSASRSLLTKATVLSYAFLPRGLVVWRFDSSGISLYQSDKSSARGLATRFVRESSDPSVEETLISKDARELYEVLIFPVIQSLPFGRVLIMEPDGVLSALPFEALRARNNSYLDEEFSILISPGWHLLNELRAPIRVDSRDRVFIATTSTEIGILGKSLPELNAEVSEIASLFPNSTVGLGNPALHNFRREMERSVIFHFAGESRINDGGATITLFKADQYQSGMVGSEEVEHLPFSHSKVVVLAACRTASSSEGLNDPENLAGAFWRLGTPQIVATRWSVDSAVTAELMRHFYQRLATRGSVEESLRAARAAVRQNPATKHPYYWAAFAVFGRPDGQFRHE